MSQFRESHMDVQLRKTEHSICCFIQVKQFLVPVVQRWRAWSDLLISHLTKYIWCLLQFSWAGNRWLLKTRPTAGKELPQTPGKQLGCIPAEIFVRRSKPRGAVLLPQLLFLAKLYHPGNYGLACGKVIPGLQGSLVICSPSCQVTDKYGEEDEWDWCGSWCQVITAQ